MTMCPLAKNVLLLGPRIIIPEQLIIKGQEVQNPKHVIASDGGQHPLGLRFMYYTY